MKLDFNELQEFYKNINNAENIVKDIDNNILSFDYMKYYSQSKKSGKLIKVSLKKNILDSRKIIYLEEKEFFNQIYNNINDIVDVKLNSGKIYRYTLKETRYKTDKQDKKGLFDMLDYKDFLKVTKQRFWTNDGLLRNGYFSGLIGTNDYNIERYKNNAKDYDLYDVDFNSAYPFCLKLPMPFGKFYTVAEWQKVKNEFTSHMFFYEIKLKTIINDFDIFLAVEPFIEYNDFDFLVSKTNSSMIVSEQRLNLINTVYGKDIYIIKKTYVCATKIYLKLAEFAEKLYKKIQQTKRNKDTENFLNFKVALNSLIGNFGRRDETKKIDKLRLINNDIIADVIAVEYTKAEYKQNQNYLLLSMVVNDITACRLFNLMSNTNVLRLCYNTDGGIIAVKKGTQIETSKSIGMLKANKIYKPLFYYCTLLYNRPLIYDFKNNKVYNSKAITYDLQKDNFICNEKIGLNTKNGFIEYENIFDVAVEKYKKFNFRQNEILLKLSNNKIYKKLKDFKQSDIQKELLKDTYNNLQKINNSYDEFYNEIRHIAEFEKIQLNLFDNFIK